MKTALVLLSLAATLLTPAARAATIDEINGPLLNKGQWCLDTDAALNAVSAKAEATLGANYDYDNTSYSLNPAGTYGLTDKLQLKVNDAYGLPYSYNYDTTMAPGGAQDHSKIKAKFQNSFNSGLTWRTAARPT